MRGKVQGLSQLKYAMGNSTEMLFYWKRCMEVSKQLVQNSSEGKKLNPKRKKKNIFFLLLFLVWGSVVFIHLELINC